MVDSINIPTTATTSSMLTFDDFNHTLSAGEEVEVLVTVDVNDLAGNFGEGDSLIAAIGEGETDHTSFDAEDEEGNDLADADKTGAETSEAHTFYDSAFNVSLVSVSEILTAGNAQASEDDRGEFRIVFDVEAFGADVYIRNAQTATTTLDTVGYQGGAAADSGVLFNVTSATTTSSTLTTGATLDTDGYLVQDGETEQFTLTVNVTAGTDSFQTVGIRAIEWALDNTADDAFFSAGLDTDWDTDPMYMEAR
jgi:hypothetical protein